MEPFVTPSTQTALLRGCRLIDPAAGVDRQVDLFIGGDTVAIAPGPTTADRVIDARGLWALPGLIDLQVHFRQPGQERKETIESGSRAAFAGGVTTVVVMPNTSPTIDTPEAVRFQQEEARRVRGARVLVAAAATVGIAGKRATDHGALAAAGAVALTDDGHPLVDDGLMEQALRSCREHEMVFMQHAEDPSLSGGHALTAGGASEALGLPGQSADAEGAMVERDVELAARCSARYHVLHLSTARSLAAVRRAKAAGQSVSCEVSPHHLLLTDEACREGDTNFKMNPPLRAEADRRALVEAVADGTVDAVATDHAPHTAEEKSRGFAEAPFGVIGLETAFSALLGLVHDGTIDARRAAALMTSGPAHVLRRDRSLGAVSEGRCADLCVVDPELRWTVTEEALFGRSKNSAFLGRELRGRVVATFAGGALRYAREELGARQR